MNKIFTIILLLTYTLTFAQGDKKEKIDTVYAASSKTTTLIFPSDVVFFDIGNEDFAGLKKGNLLLLKAVEDNVSPTSILVQYGSDIFHGTLGYHANPPKTFVDLRLAVIPNVPNESRTVKKDSAESIELEVATKRLNVLLADQKNKYKSLANQNSKEKLILGLNNMMTDQDFLYLKILFINNSKLDYQFDFIEFAYRDPYETKELKGGYDKKNVQEKFSNKIERVKARDQSMLGFVIPRYSLGKKGELLVVIREKNGTRTMSLAIPFSEIMIAETFNKK